MSLKPIPGVDAHVAATLVQLFEAHGVQAVVHQGLVRFPAHPTLWMNGDLYRVDDRVAQLDVRLGGFDGERVLVEGVMGYGDTVAAQVVFGMQLYANGSFHVLLPAFFDRPPCHGTERQVWAVGGRDRAVYPGPITTVFGYPPPGVVGGNVPDLGFYPAFMKRLERVGAMGPGVHWVRVYQMRRKGEVLCNEVVLDNEPWDEMQDWMAGYAWPVAEKAYDVRVFLVIGEE